MALAQPDARGERPLVAASALVLVVALVVGGSIVIPHLRRAVATREELPAS